jgi:hypothetical protein
MRTRLCEIHPGRHGVALQLCRTLRGALDNTFPRYNGAPCQWYPIIVLDELAMGSMMFVSGRWGLMTRTGGMMINARSETVATNGLFKWSYQQRRALMPIDGFFEWKDIYGTGKDKQPNAIAMKSGEPFALAAIWVRTTAIPALRSEFLLSLTRAAELLKDAGCASATPPSGHHPALGEHVAAHHFLVAVRYPATDLRSGRVDEIVEHRRDHPTLIANHFSHRLVDGLALVGIELRTRLKQHLVEVLAHEARIVPLGL